MRRAITFLILLASGVLSDSAASSTDLSPSGDLWPQWRGPHRDGQAAVGVEWPGRLGEESVRQLWRVELEPSYAGPIVAADRVFTVETRDEELEVVYAFDRMTGDELWNAEWDGSMTVPFFAAKNGSWVRSTPAYDGERLYVAGMRDVLVCLDAENGDEVWRVDFMERFQSPLPAFGMVCSPLVVGDAVYVQAGASLVKLDKLTGETIWRSLKDAGGTFGSAFASPVLAPIHGVDQLLVQTRVALKGVDPESGDELWSQDIPAFRGMNIVTPLPHGDGVFTCTYGGKSRLLQIEELDGAQAPVEAWQNRMQGYMTSPVKIGDHAYYFNRSNRFCCVNLNDGEIAWVSAPTGDEYWSLIAQGDRILALSNNGVLRLIQADPDAYVVIDEHEVAEGDTWAHLAVAGDQLFIRERLALSAFEWREKRKSVQR